MDGLINDFKCLNAMTFQGYCLFVFTVAVFCFWLAGRGEKRRVREAVERYRERERVTMVESPKIKPPQGGTGVVTPEETRRVVKSNPRRLRLIIQWDADNKYASFEKRERIIVTAREAFIAWADGRADTLVIPPGVDFWIVEIDPTSKADNRPLVLATNKISEEMMNKLFDPPPTTEPPKG